MEPKTTAFEAQSFCERKSSTTKKAFLVEVDDVEDSDTDASIDIVDAPKIEASVEEPVHLPVVIDLKSASENGKGNQDGGRGAKTKEDTQIACFTCFLGPCPEVVNANFKHPEFMICYRDGNSRCENGMMRYYCCPLCLATVRKGGEETFELRAVQTETNFQSAGSTEFSGAAAGNRANHDWHKYYNAQTHNLSGMQSHHSFSTHHFNCHQLPPQFSFLHHCSCSCPPQMMAYYLNYRFQTATPVPPQQQQQQQPGFRQYPYHQSYMFPSPGSAMS